MTTLDKHVAIITGASSGIGRAVAVAFAERGGRIALAARRSAELEETARLVTSRGGSPLVVPTDVTLHSQVETLIARVIEEWGKVDIVVGNAGQYIRSPAVQVTMDDIEGSIEVNFYGTARVVLAALPHMVDAGSGHVVLIASVDGKKGLPLDTPYVAAKFALVGFGDVMRQELKGHGIQVSTVLPGRVDTPFVEEFRFPLISKPIPPEKVARAVVKAVERNRAEVVVPAFNVLLVWAASLAPRLSDFAVRVLRLEGWTRRGAR